MLAGRIHQLGGPVVVEHVPEPPAPRAGQALIALVAATLNPVDVATSRGRHYSGAPRFPYIGGQEATGRLLEDAGELAAGSLVFSMRTATGTLAERFLGRLDETWELPPGSDPGAAAALGIAGLAGWLPVVERAALQPGEQVLVLGATGSAGRIALQAARLVGASRVVAAGRDRAALERLRALGADEVVQLTEGPDLERRLRDAFPGAGPDVVYDPLWGEPARAALAVAAPHARLVHLGQSAGDRVELASPDVRGKALSLLGYSNRVLPMETRRQAHLTMLAHHAAGRLQLDLQAYPLARADEAWEAVRRGAHAKPVVLP